MAWRIASSHAAVCAYCRFAVVRSDRELSARGRVADLVPTAAPIAVGDEGTIAGRPFTVYGRMQLDHGRGPWDEWYVAFGDGAWGWLARAEGRWYLTFPSDASGAPSWDELTPSRALTLPASGAARWVVTERGGSAVVSAEGELPFAIDPRGSGRYVDLEGESGAFATLDYGDGSEPIKLFVGRELAHDELNLRQAAGPRPVEKVRVERLTCPSCGAPVSIFVPSQTERAGCAACGALLDHTRGALRLLSQLEPPPIQPTFELGSSVKFKGEARTLIGFMQRSVTVDGEVYTFREYLLHAERGYSWLVEENHHWLLVETVPTGAVRERGRGMVYEGRYYRPFARNQPTVDFVIGEFYWKVAQGDRTQTEDYIAPPHVLSVERTEHEVTWSEGEYVDADHVYRAFGAKQRAPKPIGVAAAQPNPHRGRGGGYVFALLAVLWLLLAFSYELGLRKEVVYETDIALPARATQYMQPAESASSAHATLFSPPFELRGPTTLHVEAVSPIHNGAVQVDVSLIPEGGAEPRELTVVVEYYQGADGEGAWSEGSHDGDGYFGRVPSGRYTLRLMSGYTPYDSGYAPQLTPPPLHVRVTRGERGAGCCFATLLLLALPWLFRFMRASAFEQRRNENGNL